MLHAVYLINRTRTPVLSNKSPYEVLFNSFPVYDHLKVFGCLCYISTIDPKKTKFDPRAAKCIILGFQIGVKGYKVLDLNTMKLHVTRNIVFHEDIFPLKDVNADTSDFPSPLTPQFDGLSLTDHCFLILL